MDIVDKINNKMFSYDEARDMEVMLEIALLVDDSMTLNEAFDVGSFKNKMNSLMKSSGLTTHKSGEGLITTALKSGKIMAEFIWHTLKAAGGNEKSKERVKEIANTKISKEDFMDFLMKLDMATLHLIMGPIHMIEALTGWHIKASIKTKVDTATTKAKDAIKNLIDLAKTANDTTRKKMKSLISGVAKIFGVEDSHIQQL